MIIYICIYIYMSAAESTADSKAPWGTGQHCVLIMSIGVTKACSNLHALATHAGCTHVQVCCAFTLFMTIACGNEFHRCFNGLLLSYAFASCPAGSWNCM